MYTSLVAQGSDGCLTPSGFFVRGRTVNSVLVLISRWSWYKNVPLCGHTHWNRSLIIITTTSPSIQTTKLHLKLMSVGTFLSKRWWTVRTNTAAQAQESPRRVSRTQTQINVCSSSLKMHYLQVGIRHCCWQKGRDKSSGFNTERSPTLLCL